MPSCISTVIGAVAGGKKGGRRRRRGLDLRRDYTGQEIRRGRGMVTPLDSPKQAAVTAAANLARAVSDAQQHSQKAAHHESEAAIAADHAREHAVEIVQTLEQTHAHEHEALQLLEQDREGEKETHQLRTEATQLL